MSRLTEAQARALKAANEARADGAVIKGRTRAALASRFAIVPTPHGDGTYSITPTGRTLLAEHERAQRIKAPAEQVSPAAHVEPAARNEVVMGGEYDEPAAPAVPDAWIDQLVTLLDAGARIVRTDYGWRARSGMPHGFASVPDRLDSAVDEAIRLGIADALPPMANRTVRLALVKHVYKSHPYRSECRTPVTHRSGHGFEPCGRPSRHPLHL